VKSENYIQSRKEANKKYNAKRKEKKRKEKFIQANLDYLKDFL
jgi:hypothetical protein